MLEYLIPSSLYPCMKFMEACMFQLLFFYVLLEAMMLDICIRFLSGNKSVTSVTATTFKEFTVTTRARTSQTSSTLVQCKVALTTIASTAIAEIVKILTQHQLYFFPLLNPQNTRV